MHILLLLLAVGILFGSLGALCAYFITYNEWQHHYTDMRIPRKMALQTALFTLAIFMGVMIILALFLLWQ